MRSLPLLDKTRASSTRKLLLSGVPCLSRSHPSPSSPTPTPSVSRHRTQARTFEHTQIRYHNKGQRRKRQVYGARRQGHPGPLRRFEKHLLRVEGRRRRHSSLPRCDFAGGGVCARTADRSGHAANLAGLVPGALPLTVYYDAMYTDVASIIRSLDLGSN